MVFCFVYLKMLVAGCYVCLCLCLFTFGLGEGGGLDGVWVRFALFGFCTFDCFVCLCFY